MLSDKVILELGYTPAKQTCVLHSIDTGLVLQHALLAGELLVSQAHVHFVAKVIFTVIMAHHMIWVSSQNSITLLLANKVSIMVFVVEHELLILVIYHLYSRQ